MEEEPEPRVAIVREDAAEAMIAVLLLPSAVQADVQPEATTRVFARAEKGNKEKKHPKSIMEIGMLFSYAQAATSYLQYPRFFLYK